jgi:peptidoglycan/LPS O-acetylase OafA/YrhL
MLVRLKDNDGGYRADIDGLRAIAVASVVLFHAGLTSLSGGFVGVDIFFVISGYLIGAHIYRDTSVGKFSLGSFYQRRAKRILPALFFVLLVCYALSWLLLAPTELESFGRYAVASVIAVSNLLAWHTANYFAPGTDQNPLLMTWSLGVEEHFYIVFPLLMLAAIRTFKLKGERLRTRLFWMMAGAALLSFGASLVLTRTHPGAAFYLLPTRAWELAVGVLMAIYEAGWRDNGAAEGAYGGSRWSELRSCVGLSAVFFAILEYGRSTPFPGLAATAPVIGAALIISAPRATLNQWLLSSRPFRWVGLVSYSWYLWHWPLLSFARICADKPISKAVALALVAAALGLAWVSYRFVEQPFRHSKMAANPLLRRYAAACLLFGLPGVLLIATHGAPRRFPLLARQEEEIRSVTHPCVGDVPELQAQGCLPAPDGRPALALVGDSHANALVWQMRRLAADANVRLYTLTQTTCPPLLGMTTSSTTPEAQSECVKDNDDAIKFVASDPTVHVVVLAGFWSATWMYWGGYHRAGDHSAVSPEENEKNFEQGLDSTIAFLQQAGKRVIVVQDSETLRFDPVRRLRADLIPLRGLVRRRVQGETAAPGRAMNDEMYWKDNEAAAEIVTKVAARRDAETFDLRPGLCGADSCGFYEDGVLLYLDTNHLSPAGAALALRGIPLFATDGNATAK